MFSADVRGEDKLFGELVGLSVPKEMTSGCEEVVITYNSFNSNSFSQRDAVKSESKSYKID